eukprot:scaffold25288_cov112-Isochrysis_galbana.AAC.8
MLSAIDIYNTGADDPVITNDDAPDVDRPNIFVPCHANANMDRHLSIMAALELGHHPDLIGHLVLLEGRNTWMLVKSCSAAQRCRGATPRAPRRAGRGVRHPTRRWWRGRTQQRGGEPR